MIDLSQKRISNLWHFISKEPLNDLNQGDCRSRDYGGAQEIWVDPPRTVASDAMTLRTSD
jgi:hypothetical protein